jgi:chaperonin GroES
MRFQPLHDRVLIRRAEEGEQKSGSIIIPDNAKEKPTRGSVLAVGDGRVKEDGTFRPLNVRVGDSVLFGKYAGSEMEIDGEKYLVMREDEIMGVFREAAKSKGA